MLGETEKLLRTAVRKDDESLMGFLLRLADVNHCDNVRWVMRKSGMHALIPSRGHPFMFYPSLDLTLLASLASNDKEKLINATYPVIGEEGAQTATVLAYGVHLPRYMVRMHSPKICPSCLAESNYIRCVWDLAPVTACPIHTCMLLDKCQRCERLITWNRNKVSICRCNFDWRKSATHPLQEQELALTRQVYKLCGFYSGQAEISQLTNNPLLSLKLDQLLSAVFFVSGQNRGVVDTKGKFLAPNLSNFELHSSLNAAFSIFENWPIRFHQFLEWRREQRRKLKLGTGLKNDFGKLYKCLYKEFSDKSFNFMRKAFEEYVQLSWDGGCTSQVGKRSRAALRSKKYISRNEARHRLHIKIETLHYFVDIGKLNAVFLNRGQKNLMLIELADVERLESEFSEALSVNQAARQLGIGRKTVLKLVNYKCLDFLREPLANRRGELRFRRRGIDELLVKIGTSVAESENLRSVEIVTFRTAQRKLAFDNIDEGQFIKAIWEGEITPCGKGGNSTGLSALLFRRDEITHYVKSQLAQRQDPLTVKQAASLYEISERRIRLLIEQKFIPVIRNQGKRKPAILITKDAVQYFINTYVTASDLASRLATSPYHVIRLLEAKGITPVRRGRDNKLYQAVFKKEVLQNIDLDTEVLNAKGRYSQTNHKTKVLHIEQVATLLGTDMKTVSRLAEGGLLKSYSGSYSKKHGDATCHFTSSTLEGCKNRIVSYMCLLSEPRVKQIIRQTPMAFYIVRVKEGHPEPGNSEMESNIQQPLEGKVGALITLLKQTMTLSEVEAKWGVEPRMLKRRIAKGALKTISKSTAGGFKYHLFLRRDIKQLHRLAA